MSNIAIVGAGAMGACHAKAYEAVGAKVAYIVNRKSERALALAAAHGAQLVESLAALTGDQVDAVDICLPNHLHEAAIMAALQITPHVLCEKPICLTMAEFLSIEHAVAAADAHLMVAQVVRFWDSHLALMHELGGARPSAILCKRRQKPPKWSAGNWLLDKEKSGGILYDLAIHDVDFIVNHFGMPRTVAATQNEGNCSILLDYGDFSATLLSSWDMAPSCNGGAMENSLEILVGGDMLLYDNTKSLNALYRYGQKGTEEIPLTLHNAYNKELSYFINCIQNGEKPARADLQSVKNTMLVLEACKASAHSQKEISHV